MRHLRPEIHAVLLCSSAGMWHFYLLDSGNSAFRLFMASLANPAKAVVDRSHSGSRGNSKDKLVKEVHRSAALFGTSGDDKAGAGKKVYEASSLLPHPSHPFQRLSFAFQSLSS
jgi:hypothetical protein